MPEHAICYRMDLDGKIDNRTGNIRQWCHDYGVGTPQVQVIPLLKALEKPFSRRELQEKLGLRNREHFRRQYLKPALEAWLIVMSNPDKPRAADQKYSITELGKSVIVEKQ